MEKINWFPGHMKKALRMMENEARNVDALIYVLDSRAPLACLNPEFVKIVGLKPILFVLNKVDLANTKKLDVVSKQLSGENSVVIRLNSTASGAIKVVSSALENLCGKTIQKYKQKGVNYFVRAMVVGVPNCGKSTLVNNLCGVKKATTGNKPGVTKGKQWVRLSNNIEILDTPGTLWPNLTNDKDARKLAYIGSIKDDVVECEQLSLFLIEDLSFEYKSLIEARYGIEIGEKSPLMILEEIALSRKFLLRGGEVDYQRASKSFIDDFRKGRLGKITL